MSNNDYMVRQAIIISQVSDDLHFFGAFFHFFQTVFAIFGELIFLYDCLNDVHFLWFIYNYTYHSLGSNVIIILILNPKTYPNMFDIFGFGSNRKQDCF